MPRGFILPPGLKKTLLPACLAALGLAAWEDVPLSAALRPWVAHVTEARNVLVTPAAPAAPRLDEAKEDPRPVPLSEEAATSSSARAEVSAEASGTAPDAQGFGLPHSHSRRVDHVARARSLRELGDLSGALTECRRALHDDAEDTDALAQLAVLARLQGQPELAARAYGQLGRLETMDTEPLVRQARLLVSLGRYTDAVRVGEEALLRDPEDPEVYQVLGRAHLSANELPSAILRFQQAVHLDPEHGYALNNLGFAYLRASENQKAAEVLAQAAALLPHVAYVHNNLGVAYERLGRMEEARASYATATRLSPRYVQARVNAERMKHVARVDVPAPSQEDAAFEPPVPFEATGTPMPAAP
jgi:Flp pilus assembly protein TadD